ncbi:MAG: two-component system sensor histidine kinase KdpD [Candidatus Competibacteraceae bacterium]
MNSDTDQRPDPDELLKRYLDEETQARRGKLRIFFGASAGVGKTYAMLQAARQLRAQGLDVVVGIVETHGRVETETLLEGLEVLPRREIPYRDRMLKEFDLDAALKRKPALILVDELAHSNVPGSRHPKRWQDIEELLAAGIDVYTTVNVQHLESLNDVVGSITDIRVWETVPDRVFEKADEVVLVDLPPDELLHRLKEGKVYLPEQAERAIRNFFRKGNLIALREMALRRTADRVDDQMLAYRRDLLAAPVWQTRDAILACIGPQAGAEKVVRSASRLAAQLEVPWHAVYVETPTLQRLPEARRRAILKTLKLAQDLGAVTATLPADDIATAIVSYARKHNLAKLVVGRTSQRTWWRFRRALTWRIGQLAADIDIVAVARDTDQSRAKATVVSENGSEPRPARWTRYGWALVVCAVTTGLTLPLQPYLEQANIVMLFLLAVVIVAVRFGRGPATLAAVVNVAAFDFFFVPPRLSFSVHDLQYLLTFAVMLSVGLITGQLTAGLRYQARIAGHREERSRDLYQMARELSGALTEEQIAEISDRYIEASFRARAEMVLPDEAGEKLLPCVYVAGEKPTLDLGIAQWVYDRSEPAGIGTDTLPGSSALYLPLKAPLRTRGVLVVEPTNSRILMIPEQRRHLEIFTTLIAIALERVHFVTIAREALVRMESERLRNSLLSALSHDLRTPLTALVGLADSLELSRPPLAAGQSELTKAIREQALRTSELVNKVLDMARLQAGGMRLNRQWQSLEEVVGSALKAREALLADHQVEVRLPVDLQLLEFDAVLIERVLVNLLENAAKYTPVGSEITVEAVLKGKDVEIAVDDNGPGLPPGMEQAIFEKFIRGTQESANAGIGLGLAICKAIVEAHQGRIWAENRPTGGARFAFTLPLGNPPSVEPEIGVEHATE